MSLHPSVARALEEIDAALFSSDTFHHGSEALLFEKYLRRWQREWHKLKNAGIVKIKIRVGYVIRYVNKSEGVRYSTAYTHGSVAALKEAHMFPTRSSAWRHLYQHSTDEWRTRAKIIPVVRKP